ncbi:Oxysterol-binding protein-domain-containing protein [Gilbertella persicaria]|uniref:Oxysterol-binding protein-domain-containing protein n=1 Tax=Gilbertella persicaria TaxID=101096 RepID=UPI00221E3EAC|nr:Oxysterol-binding protein-domain-containing protein [Gilbertella persicaria]KAI8077907.1 Oxysterol-binding protein-domain-containing protein [Gilbertella persicaria]
MFSRNTSKLLSFAVTSDEPIDEGLDLDSDMSGWLLKKRRKRMQGWAKRWFELSSTGVLSYSLRKNDLKRGSLQIALATIAISANQRILHLDSGTTVFHLKALSEASFEQWLKCIRARRSSQHSDVLVWNEDTHLQTATSGFKGEQQEDEIISKALLDLGAEIQHLKQLVLTELPSLLSHDSIQHKENESSSQPTSPTHIKFIRLPFRRHSSIHLEEKQSQEQILEKLNASIESLHQYQEILLNTYHKQHYHHPLDIPSRTGTGFLSHRSAGSFYSYSVLSDTYYDAEDYFISTDDNDSIHDSVAIDSEDEDDAEEDDKQEKKETHDALFQANTLCVTRRTRLPHPVAVKSISFLGILRKNIGKDLSTITMPITLNEPINLLQRLCEELEYTELLDKASTLPDSMDRLMYVTMFAISGYASSQYRIGRKPFNPLLCETYECIRPDRGFRFISEKVSHSPNIMACHAESSTFEYRQHYQGKTKFWGKSMELISEGQSYIQLKGHEDHYTYSKPSSWLRNLVAGAKYLEHVGEMKVCNHATGETAMVTFKEATVPGSGFFSNLASNHTEYRNHVVAKLYDSDGHLSKEIKGRHSEFLSEVVGPDQYTVLWRCKPPCIPDYDAYYGFTSFVMELNEITPIEINRLPMTDTRYRPDQRLLEDGKVTEAEDRKLLLEERQRERRRKYETEGKLCQPLWFELKADALSPIGESWQYKGGYWEARESGQWPKDMLQLW